jgi:hypothetical protein
LKPKKYPTTCDGRVMKAESKFDSATNSATALQSQTKFIVRRFGLPPVHAALKWATNLISGAQDGLLARMFGGAS